MHVYVYALVYNNYIHRPSGTEDIIRVYAEAKTQVRYIIGLLCCDVYHRNVVIQYGRDVCS